MPLSMKYSDLHTWPSSSIFSPFLYFSTVSISANAFNTSLLSGQSNVKDILLAISKFEFIFIGLLLLNFDLVETFTKYTDYCTL